MRLNKWKKVMSHCKNRILTATGSDEKDGPKPDGDTGSIASDEPDCGVYVRVNVYVSNVVPDVHLLYL